MRSLRFILLLSAILALDRATIGLAQDQEPVTILRGSSAPTPPPEPPTVTNDYTILRGSSTPPPPPSPPEPPPVTNEYYAPSYDAPYYPYYFQNYPYYFQTVPGRFARHPPGPPRVPAQAPPPGRPLLNPPRR